MFAPFRIRALCATIRVTNVDMKGCLVVQRRFLYLAHEVAIHLKEMGVVDEFCAFMQVRQGYNFLKEQQNIRYTSLVLEEDLFKQAKAEKLDMEYLTTLEAEVGNLWRCIEVDRLVRHGQHLREYPHDQAPYSYEDMLRIVQTLARRITKMLDEEKPDFIFIFQPGSLGLNLFYAIAKSRGIKIFLPDVPSVPNLTELSEIPGRMSFAEEIFKNNLEKDTKEIAKYNEAKEYVDTFRNKPRAYSSVAGSREKKGRLAQFGFLMPSNFFYTIYFNFFRIFVDWWKDPERRTDYSTVNPFLFLYDRMKRKIRNLRSLSDLYDNFDPAVSYAFFPLQHEPELQVLLLAPFNTDQLDLAKRIARCLPVGMYLYVKDHPEMVPYRTRRFFRQLKKIPNLKLLDPSISGFDVTKHAALITTINSSIGWEGALVGKPVITFGNTYYNSLSKVYFSKTPEELPEMICRALKKGACSVDELYRFVAALMEDGVQLDLLYIWEVETDSEKRRSALKPYAELLARKVQKLKYDKNYS
ncbi:MAG: hypothetical protein UY70_C0006G0025 [Candidatus Kaiserbacteria bacterium GW2011_GWB1_52_6]|uniref:Capsule polysaccharide biosynthesis protein n=2 Tax=Candidatus Kaiseribacteriota TaxID=1752734 RepID=A0A0G2AGA7_9BACT|nr:MAG: hypothetical protein UY70_C0006G0025 [Candidatus Kaiserbacteria bacterium GW2011_GWB1_52_6]KKW31564.1 MAG: hypothetical protein UY74_C0011G0007 [Candidatus Kaiserbacteria bacterium GW2011_GWC2_52_8b]